MHQQVVGGDDVKVVEQRGDAVQHREEDEGNLRAQASGVHGILPDRHVTIAGDGGILERRGMGGRGWRGESFKERTLTRLVCGGCIAPRTGLLCRNRQAGYAHSRGLSKACGATTH